MIRSPVETITETRYSFTVEVGEEMWAVHYFPDDNSFVIRDSDGDAINISMAAMEEIRLGMGDVLGKMFT